MEEKIGKSWTWMLMKAVKMTLKTSHTAMRNIPPVVRLKARTMRQPVSRMLNRTSSRKALPRNLWLWSRMTSPSYLLRLALTVVFMIQGQSYNALNAISGFAMVKAIKMTFMEVILCGIWLNQIIRRSDFTMRARLRTRL